MGDWEGSHHHWVFARTLEASGAQPPFVEAGHLLHEVAPVRAKVQRSPPCRTLPGEGSPVKTKITFLSATGVRSSSWSLMRSSRPLKNHIRQELRWRGAMRHSKNSFTTLGTVTPSSLKSAKRHQTKMSRGLVSVSWPQPELGIAGDFGSESRGMGTSMSTYSHRSRNPGVDGGTLKSIPEAAISGAAMKLTHPEH